MRERGTVTAEKCGKTEMSSIALMLKSNAEEPTKHDKECVCVGGGGGTWRHIGEGVVLYKRREAKSNISKLWIPMWKSIFK